MSASVGLPWQPRFAWTWTGPTVAVVAAASVTPVEVVLVDVSVVVPSGPICIRGMRVTSHGETTTLIPEDAAWCETAESGLVATRPTPTTATVPATTVAATRCVQSLADAPLATRPARAPRQLGPTRRAAVIH